MINEEQFLALMEKLDELNTTLENGFTVLIITFAIFAGLKLFFENVLKW